MIITKEDNLFFVVIALILLALFIISFLLRGYSSRMLEEMARKFQRWLFVIALFSSIMWFAGRHIAKTLEADALVDLILLPGFICWMLWAAGVLAKACNGYKFQDGKLVFRRWFIRKTVGKESIRNVILSVAKWRSVRIGKTAKRGWFGNKIWPYPFLTLESEETSQMLYTPRPGKWEVSDLEAWEWSREYGHFIYGFLYDPYNPPDWLFKNYTGHIFISYSLLAMYCDEFFSFLEENGIKKSRVSIIKDKTTYEDFPREVDEAYVDQRIREFYQGEEKK